MLSDVCAGRGVGMQFNETDVSFRLGGKQHTVRFQTHHFPGQEIFHKNKVFANQFFRVMEFGNAGKNLSFFRSDGKPELQELFALFYFFAGKNLGANQFHLAEVVKGAGLFGAFCFLFCFLFGFFFRFFLFFSLEDFLWEISSLKGISVNGLMTIPPICDDENELNKYF